MKIGLDLSVLQTPHRMRGVGATALNFVNNIPKDIYDSNTFVFYLYNDNADEVLDILKLKNIKYEIRYINKIDRVNITLPRHLKIINGVINQLLSRKELYMGDSRIKDLSGVEYFIQFDQNQPLPSTREVKSILILYDIIPYVMEADYLWGYKYARNNGRSRRNSLRLEYHRRKYKSRLKLVTKKASTLIAISEYTKSDFIKHIGIKEDKIMVCHLGVSQLNNKSSQAIPKLNKMIKTSWGYVSRPLELKDKMYILFVGGVDPRRKLVELLAAFNNLRAQGFYISLVLAGDTMNGPETIPNIEVQKYLKSTSYLEDIYFLGYIDDNQRDWLYENALAFIYPSVYEGFGLPILEAMRYGTPVITYENTSIKEIAGNNAIYAKDMNSIKDSIIKLLESKTYYEKYSALGKKQFSKFGWEQTIKNIFKLINF